MPTQSIGAIAIDPKDPSKYVGFDIDLGEEIGECLGFKVTYKAVTFAALLTTLASGQADIVISDIYATEERAKAAVDVFKEKLIRRDISMKAFDAGEPHASGKTYKVSGSIKQGIDSENAKKITKLIRDEGPKGVKTQIQGDEVRVSSKKRDDLQAVIAML